ncbi:MAG: ABC transporter ATP-binding protein [Proteobacteria bacterium]|nr:ABC transporter ATP-binding protein [Pseudomonadota bacterium]
MSDIVIKSENLGKKYIIGHQEERSYTALRDVLMQNARTLWNKTKDLAKGNAIIQGDTLEEMWALKDVSFEIRSGEPVGIIGRNGAGKSTLLKVLSRITEPSAGRVTIKGRVASLLEVGTGFHPELTGRENIYLNGAILGMSRKEIKRKFDEIVSFAEVEKYLDTPVKRYSSGMYVRLAFAVAAHLEPEILLVDEVLAVGDVQFQKKCLGKMGDVAREGRTVLFVSHNMAAMRNLCQRVILLDSGKVAMDSDASDVVSCYLDEKTVEGAIISSDALEKRMEGYIRRKNPIIRLREVALIDRSGLARQTFYSDEGILVSMVFECFKQVQNLHIAIYIVNDDGSSILGTLNLDDTGIVENCYNLNSGVYRAICTFPANTFGEKRFFLDVHLQYIKTEHLIFQKILGFDVKFKGYNNITDGCDPYVHFRPRLKWDISPLNNEWESKHV